MSIKELRERATLYSIIIAELVEKYPVIDGKLHGEADEISATDADVRVTSGYARWIKLSGGHDVSGVQLDFDEAQRVPGKYAVQFLLTHSVSIVMQLLAQEVDPDVAVKLLPYELALAAHYEYVNRTT